jgi:hypothetical protein
MKRWRIPAIVVVLSIAAVLCILVCTRHRYPVLFHISGSCACTDYSEEVEGWSVFNPFRDRSPEASADTFLEDLRQGRPLTVAPDFGPADWLHIVHNPVAFEWRLRHRRDQPHRVSLYYQFTRLDGKPYQRWSGEGTVAVVEMNGNWKTQTFDVVW